MKIVSMVVTLLVSNLAFADICPLGPTHFLGAASGIGMFEDAYTSAKEILEMVKTKGHPKNLRLIRRFIDPDSGMSSLRACDIIHKNDCDPELIGGRAFTSDEINQMSSFIGDFEKKHVSAESIATAGAISTGLGAVGGLLLSSYALPLFGTAAGIHIVDEGVTHRISAHALSVGIKDNGCHPFYGTSDDAIVMLNFSASQLVNKAGIQSEAPATGR
jgi:hypothetical protein